jgi:hypothetical protein
VYIDNTNTTKTITVKSVLHKNRLDLICKSYCGYYSESLLQRIIELNPKLNMYENGVNVGDKLVIPKRGNV